MDQTMELPPLSLTPALMPPPGHIPNFDNPENFHGAIIATTVVCLTLTTLLAFSRMYTKLIITKSHGWDDYTYFVGWLGLIGYCAVGAVGMRYGNGVHQYDVNVLDAIQFGKLANANEVYYTVLIFITKLSILLQYLRIFVPNRQGPAYYIAQFLIWANLIAYLIIGFCALFQCSPRESIWNPLVPGTCLNFGAILVSGGVINIISDFSILALPLTSTWRLQMATRHKIGISAVFALAFFACIASIMRLVLSVKANQSKDSTWDLVIVYLWTVAEITSALICASLPVLPQFCRHSISNISSKFLSSSQRKSTSQGTPNHRPYAGSNTPKIRPSSGVWHDLRDMRTPSNAPYVQFDNSETAALATRSASADGSRGEERGPSTTPPGKGTGGETWDGPIVRQTDLESGASVDGWQPKR